MISGCIIVKDVLKQGYPFVEAVASALPICDEFLISEGYSTDGTLEIVQRMTKLNKKIKMFQQEWPETKNYTVLADITNAVRRKCKFDYILSIQANEIIHEDNVAFIKNLPHMCPQVHTFSFPFWHFVHKYKFYEDFRLRFAKNLPGIVATGDAWSLGPSKAFVNSQTLRSAGNPKKLARFLRRGIEWTYANACANPISRAMYLPKPIFRYWSIYPSHHLEKSTKYASKFGLTENYQTVETLKNYVNDQPSFWKHAAELMRTGFNFSYNDTFGVVSIKDHPRLVQNLLSDSARGYTVKENVLDSIRNL